LKSALQLDAFSGTPGAPIEIVFTAFAEDTPGPKWQSLFRKHWHTYERWFLGHASGHTPYYLSCVRALRQHMPELVPVYEKLVALAGGGDTAARFLSMVNPPPYLTGCSQAALGGSQPLLVRNYDYSPHLCEGTILHTQWAGRRVIAMSDCLWGALDGINQDGLAVSLSFGGRRVVGEGFGVPLIVRYVLETCSTATEACATLARIPTHMSYNVTVLDASGDIATAYLAPDRAPNITRDAVTTNHQGEPEWQEHARATASIERERYLQQRLADPALDRKQFSDAFLERPLHSTALEEGFGTLYTAAYSPREGRADYRWPGDTWTQSFVRFDEGQRAVRFDRTRREHST
jgi:predicted choloylglycine hydrolase